MRATRTAGPKATCNKLNKWWLERWQRKQGDHRVNKYTLRKQKGMFKHTHARIHEGIMEDNTIRHGNVVDGSYKSQEGFSG